MMANYWPHLLAMLVGGALTVQVGMNATLARVIGSPLWASAVNFAVGLLALVGFAAVAGSRASTGSFGQVRRGRGWGACSVRSTSPRSRSSVHASAA